MISSSLVQGTRLQTPSKSVNLFSASDVKHREEMSLPSGAHHPSHAAHQAQNEQNANSALPGLAAAVWTNPNPPLHRGRAPKDPMAVVAKYDCASIEDLELKFREYLDNPPAAAEHCTCELTLWAGASFLVTVSSDSATPGPNPHPRPNVNASSNTNANANVNAGMLQPVADALNPEPETPAQPRSEQLTMSVLDALQATPDPKVSMKRQRAISKVCVAAIQRVDGFRYSFHNNWRSGEDNAYRFSYYCNDSLLNKDRVANGKAGSQGTLYEDQTEELPLTIPRAQSN
jgi:hypothetical protein